MRQWEILKAKKDLSTQHDGLKDEPWREQRVNKPINKMKPQQNASLNPPQNDGLGDVPSRPLPAVDLRLVKT